MRVKRGVTSRRRHKRVFKLAEGMRGRTKNCFKVAKIKVQKALRYAYRDRKAKKRTFRSLWIVRINAATRQHGISYSDFIYGLKKANITLDRKAMAEFAAHDPVAFAALAEKAKAALQ